jgi:putative chitinase
MDIVSMVADHADEVFTKYGITTPRRQACVLAHMFVETLGFTRLEENLNYSAERLREVFPSHFTPAQAEACAHNPTEIANRAYGGRMGNNHPDDGWIFRGKGLWQCTGRSNGERLGKYLGVNADIAASWLIHPDHALECACALFHVLNVAPSADSGNVIEQTKRINGGLNGLQDRKNAYAKAMRLLSVGIASHRIALFDDPNTADPSPVSIHDLREDGSRTIQGADQAQRGLVGTLGSIGGATAVLQQTNDVVSQAQNAVDTLSTSASYLTWTQHHWHILALAGFTVLAAFFVYRAWQGAQAAKLARVDDANTGANLARV